MESDRLPRKLVAVLYADVAGYSRLTEADEDATHRRLRADLDHFADAIGACHGRVVHYAGDAILATFESAVDALSCAAHAQTEFTRRNADLAEERRIRFRIGLNLGDVIEDRGDVYGDGVNVAARLETLAEPGGICVSGSFHDAIGAQLPFEYSFLGEQSVKNIRKPVRAYHASLREGAELPAMVTATRAPDATPTRTAAWLSIAIATGIALLAVLAWWQPWSGGGKPAPGTSAVAVTPAMVIMPFVNLSNDPAQTYLADGITADLITELSRLSNLTIMAMGTSLKLRDEKLSPMEIGKKLGVSHVLEGSVRKAGDNLRITCQLVDARNGHQLWGERYDRQLVDVFAVQDDVVRSIVSALAVNLTVSEREKLDRDTRGDFDAYDAFLRGQKLAQEGTRESNARAIATFEAAIARDPVFARAYGALAVAMARSYSRGWTDTPVETLNRALSLAVKAVTLDRGLPQAYWAHAFTLMIAKRLPEALAEMERGVAIAPNFADGYGLLALINNELGNGDRALELIRKAIALNPFYTWDYPYNVGRAQYNLGHYAEALPPLNDALQRNPNARPARLYLIATLVNLGRMDDAAWEVDQLRVTSPQFTLRSFRQTASIADPARLDAMVDALRRAGLPE